jgi:hypothetical protein
MHLADLPRNGSEAEAVEKLAPHPRIKFTEYDQRFREQRLDPEHCSVHEERGWPGIHLRRQLRHQ